MNSFMKQKLLAAKEDLLQNNSRVKRNLRLMVEVHHSTPSTKQLTSSEWKIRVEGRLIGNESEEDLLNQDATSNKRFLNFFERVRIEFPGSEDLYPPVDWVKAKSNSGAAFDCFEIARTISKDQKRKLASPIVKVKLTFHLESNPRRYRLSPTLSRVLGGMDEATRL